jgi:hypothetical protein
MPVGSPQSTSAASIYNPARMPRTAAVAVMLVLPMAVASAQRDVLSTLGTTLEEARNSIFSSFATGIPALGGERTVFKAASPDERAVMVRAVIALARTFVSSPEFARRYALYRKAQEPQPAEVPRTGDEARQQQQESIELAIKQATAGAANLPPEARRQLEESIAEMRKQIAELNADPEYRAQVDRAAAADAREAAADFKRQRAMFNSEFPEQVNALVARRLRQFLLACSDVDFAAKLEPTSEKKMRFVNPAYERRSAEWKMCYRAGKPAVDAARAAAEEWLKAIE